MGGRARPWNILIANERLGSQSSRDGSRVNGSLFCRLLCCFLGKHRRFVEGMTITSWV